MSIDLASFRVTSRIVLLDWDGAFAVAFLLTQPAMVT
ncbi:hypothetical protein BH18ACI4_BH18ACI4_22180 [soil metagenome]